MADVTYGTHQLGQGARVEVWGDGDIVIIDSDGDAVCINADQVAELRRVLVKGDAVTPEPDVGGVPCERESRLTWSDGNEVTVFDDGSISATDAIDFNQLETVYREAARLRGANATTK